jgi:predicted glycoside hydrolase/deacetylase ChbG (UPF0249 family)
MGGERVLIVNADDFGQSAGINRGVIAAHERGIVTSASLMVRWPAAEAAADFGRAHPDLGVGLHVDLGEWVYRDEEWVPLYEVVSSDDHGAVAEEAASQLATFRRLVGKDPTHLDSHQHVHMSGPARAILTGMALDLAIPLRRCSPHVRYQGDFYGQTGTGVPLDDALTVDRLIELIRALPPGMTELACHPGAGDDPSMVYNRERALEVECLCNPRVRAAITQEGIALRSFRDVTF